MKKLKQGQTIYRIDLGLECNPPKPSLIKIFLHSRKQELPLEGSVILKYPVDYVNKIIAKHGSKYIYASKRKAMASLKGISRWVHY